MKSLYYIEGASMLTKLFGVCNNYYYNILGDSYEKREEETNLERERERGVGGDF